MHVINRCTEYAILSLLHMTEKNEVVSAQELASNLRIPHPFLRGILRTLKEHGLIGSRRGQRGGFLLRKDPQKITLLEIMSVFQGPFKLTECGDTQECPRLGGCSLRRELEAAENLLVKRLEETTLNQLFKNGSGRNHTISRRKKENIC